MDVEIFETKEFLKAVKAMKLAGGRKSKAADQVLAMRGSVALFENPFESLRKTKHAKAGSRDVSNMTCRTSAG
jgi:hypothetical protein